MPSPPTASTPPRLQISCTPPTSSEWSSSNVTDTSPSSADSPVLVPIPRSTLSAKTGASLARTLSNLSALSLTNPEQHPTSPTTEQPLSPTDDLPSFHPPAMPAPNPRHPGRTQTHHCPERAKGNCRPTKFQSITFCSTHQTLCTLDQLVHLDTETCIKCDARLNAPPPEPAVWKETMTRKEAKQVLRVLKHEKHAKKSKGSGSGGKGKPAEARGRVADLFGVEVPAVAAGAEEASFARDRFATMPARWNPFVQQKTSGKKEAAADEEAFTPPQSATVKKMPKMKAGRKYETLGRRFGRVEPTSENTQTVQQQPPSHPAFDKSVRVGAQATLRRGAKPPKFDDEE